MNDATIIRTQRDKDHPYIILNKTFANDRRLSWEARGMMTFFLSKPDDWQIWPKALIKESPAGRDAVYRILKELELAGYLTRRQVTSAGKFGATETVISEVPSHTDEFDRALLSRKRTKDQPYTEKPDTDQPYTENPEHTNKGSVPSTDSNQVTTTMQPEPTTGHRQPTTLSAASAAGGGGAAAEGTGINTPVTGKTPKGKDTPAAAYLRGAVQLDAEKVIAELGVLDLDTVRSIWNTIKDQPAGPDILKGRLVNKLRAYIARQDNPDAPALDQIAHAKKIEMDLATARMWAAIGGRAQ